MFAPGRTFVSLANGFFTRMTASRPDAPAPPVSPRLTERAEAAAAERRVRQAEALRENLRRRKQQARARTEPEAADPAPPAGIKP